MYLQNVASCLQLLVLKRAIADIRQTLQEMVCLFLFFMMLERTRLGYVMTWTKKCQN